MMALLHPAEVDRLVVVDVAPAANPPTLLSYVKAMRAVDLHGAKRRSEVDAQLAGAVPDAAERAFLVQNLLIGDGETRWRLNLAAIERGFPEISAFRNFPLKRPIPVRPCLSQAPAPTISAPSTNRRSIACFRSRTSRESKAPGIGFMPSSPGRFCRRPALSCQPPLSFSGRDGNRLAPVRPKLISIKLTIFIGAILGDRVGYSGRAQ